MSYDIGTARGVIELDYNGRGVDQAQEDLQGIKKAGGEANKGLKTTAKIAGRAGLAISGGIALAINSAATFEQRMSAVSAVSGASADEMKKLSDKALQLGKDTAFSASEGASAIEELVKAGLSVADVMNGAADATVALAAAGEVDLKTAATIASNAMNQFGLSAEDLPNVADKLAGAANASAIDVGDLGQSMQQVGAVAKLAGATFDDTATAIALMGNAGIKGSDAGTSLKSMFMRLQPVTDKQSALFKELGIITEDGTNKFFTASGGMKNLSEVAGILNKSLGFNRDAQEEVNKAVAKGVDPMKAIQAEAKKSGKDQQFMSLQTLFGADAIRAAAIMATNGSKGFKSMAKAMGKVKAADVAATRMDNLKGSLEQVKGSLETVGIQIGTIFLPIVRKVIDFITMLLNKFLNLSGTWQKVIVIAIVASAAFLLVVATVIKMVLFIGKLQKALAAYRAFMLTTAGQSVAAWAAILGPILLVVAIIAVLIGVFVLLYKKNEKFRDFVNKAWAGIKKVVSKVVKWFKSSVVPILAKVWGKIQDGLKEVWGFFKKVWPTIYAIVKTYVKLWWKVISTYIKVIVKIFSVTLPIIFEVVKQVFTMIWDVISRSVKVWWIIISTAIILIYKIMKSVFTLIYNIVKAIWARIGDKVVDKIKEIVGFIQGVYGKFIKPFVNAATWLYDIGKKIFGGLWKGLKEIWDKVKKWFDDRIKDLQKLKDKLTGATQDGAPQAPGPIGGNSDGSDPYPPPGPSARVSSYASDARPSASTLVMASAGSTASRGSSAVSSSASGTAPRGGLRVIDGELRLDPSGRAFISGVAADEIAGTDDYNDLLGRMG